MCEPQSSKMFWLPWAAPCTPISCWGQEQKLFFKCNSNIADIRVVVSIDSTLTFFRPFSYKGVYQLHLLLSICDLFFVVVVSLPSIPSKRDWPRRPKRDGGIKINKQPDGRAEWPNLTIWPKIEVLYFLHNVLQSYFDIFNYTLIQWVGTIVNQYSAIWSNSAIRFCIYSAICLNIWLSSFLFIRLLDLAYPISSFQNNIRPSDFIFFKPTSQ